MTAAGIHAAILAAWRIEQPRLITSLSRMLRDVPLAEELTQDALVAALEALAGIGRAGASGRVADGDRKAPRARSSAPRQDARAQARDAGGDLEREQQAMPDFDAALDDDIGDEMLRLIFTACHPLLSREARAALALRMICGLTTEEIARAFLVPEATISQRIVRAKRTLSEAGSATKPRAARRCPNGSPRCWRWSISSSTRATRPRAATTGCGRNSARRRCAWAVCWSRSRPASRRRTACWR